MGGGEKVLEGRKRTGFLEKEGSTIGFLKCRGGWGEVLEGRGRG